MAFIKTLRAPAGWHAVYGQTRVNRASGQVEQAIVVHKHPNAAAEFHALQLPSKFGEFPVIELDWPAQDL